MEWLSVYHSKGEFKNLLLDGRCLEFWEIILLAAGDVERNPGPRRMTGTICAQLHRIRHTLLMLSYYDC